MKARAEGEEQIPCPLCLFENRNYRQVFFSREGRKIMLHISSDFRHEQLSTKYKIWITSEDPYVMDREEIAPEEAMPEETESE